MKLQIPREVARSTALLCALLAIALLPELALAQAGNTDGAPFVQKLKDWWFGPIGLAIGFLIGAWGVVEWVRDGFKTALPIFAVCIAWFFVPAVVLGVQNLAK